MTPEFLRHYNAAKQREYRSRIRKSPTLRISTGRAHTKRAGIPDGMYDVTVTPSCVYLFPKAAS